MFEDNGDLRIARIKVIGVGGGGNNAVNRMIESGITSADFYAVNTDKQTLMLSKVPMENRLQIGQQLTKGLGAGSQPELGEAAAEESKDEISAICDNTDLLFIAAGMGGGTGTGAAPVIAKIAKEKGCLTVACVTKPFSFEGKKRAANAVKGIANLSKYVDTIIIIPNDKILEALPTDTPFLTAFSYADDTLRQGVCGISDLISTPALINLDFADVRTILSNQGLAHMGIGRAKGENRIVEAVRQAVSSSMLETTIEGATGVIINITGGKDITIGQIHEGARLVQNVIDDSANIIFGANVNESLNEEVVITIIATGFKNKGDLGDALQSRKNISERVERFAAERQPEQFENKTSDYYREEKTAVTTEDRAFTKPEEGAFSSRNVPNSERSMDEGRYSAPDTDSFKIAERNYDVSEGGEEHDDSEEEKKGLPLFVRKFLNRKK